jgi:hypothetical protein
MINPLILPGHVYELRAPRGRQGTISGYFDNAADIYEASRIYDGKVPGLYVTLNPVKNALLARAKNRLNTTAKTTTSDPDILKRYWLLIDCDAVRPAEISANEAEHQAALDRSTTVAEWLWLEGWPDSIRADSGNGAHLLYRIDLQNDTGSRDLVKAVLEVLALRFNDACVVIDTSVFNAARITKLYGTLSCKGDSTEDRPHRQSQILSVPSALVPVPDKLLNEMAQRRPVDPKTFGTNRTGFDVRNFISRHHLSVAREKPWNGGTVFELETCPFNSEHIRDSSIIQYPTGAVSFQCFHNSCQQHRWQQLRDLLEPARRHAFRMNGSEPQATPGEPADFTLRVASSVAMKPVKWGIQDRVPLGMLTVLAGRGGLGKGTIAADWAAQLSKGLAAGALAGKPSSVIISSTEDTEKETLAPRLAAAQADMARVHFIHLHRGGVDGSLSIPEDIDILHQAIQQADAKFIIIDPLMSHLSATLNGWNDQEIRRALTPLSRLAEQMQIAVLVIAHLNKDSKKEAIDRIGGSVGISNTARSVLFCGTDPQDPDGGIRMLAHPKCNVGREQPTLRYQIDEVLVEVEPEPIKTTRIVWLGEAPGYSADDLVGRPEPMSRDDRERALTWLGDALPIGSRKRQTDLEADAEKNQISKWALRKAKIILQVKSKKTGFNPTVWWWSRDPVPYNSMNLSPSDKTSSKLLKLVKKSEGESPHIFDIPSMSEDVSKHRPLPFDTSSEVSTPCSGLCPQGESQGSYTEVMEPSAHVHEEVDLVD